MTSSVPGEGKTTISANLAISCAMSGKKVLLVDSDLRRASQREMFHYDSELPGLSDILAGKAKLAETVFHTRWEMLDILPAGRIPQNPDVLMGGERMEKVLSEAEEQYDLVIVDMPPVNVLPDALMVSDCVAGCLLVVRQDYTDIREVRKAMGSAEMTKMNILGFVFYGEKVRPVAYYDRKQYKNYYNSSPA